MSSRAASDVIRGNNNIIRASILMLECDTEYRMTATMIDSVIGSLNIAEKTLLENPSIDLLGAYAETVDLVSKILKKHEMHEFAILVAQRSESLKKEVFSPIFSA